jgi:hypothetical protein
MKHIEVRHHYIREQVAAQVIALEYVNTSQMAADVLTSRCSQSSTTTPLNFSGRRLPHPHAIRCGSSGEFYNLRSLSLALRARHER